MALAAAVAMSFSAGAHAATVTALQGQVLVNGGTGYRLVDGSTGLGPGGTVVANPGAAARVVYAGGCSVTVQPGSVYLIAAQSPCSTGAPISVGGLTDNGPTGKKTAATDTDDESSWGNPWLLGGAALAAGGGAAYLVMSMSP